MLITNRARMIKFLVDLAVLDHPSYERHGRAFRKQTGLTLAQQRRLMAAELSARQVAMYGKPCTSEGNRI